jgi:hypothetical protein
VKKRSRTSAMQSMRAALSREPLGIVSSDEAGMPSVVHIGRRLLGSTTARDTYIGLGVIVAAIVVLSCFCCVLHCRRRGSANAEAELSKELTEILSQPASIRSVSSTLTSPRMMARALAREPGTLQDGENGRSPMSLGQTPSHPAVQPRKSAHTMHMLASGRRHHLAYDGRGKLPTIPSVTSLASKETRSGAQVPLVGVFA